MAVAELDAAYVFLRNVEHRLQYQRRRRRICPPDDGEREALARACGSNDAASFGRLLDRHRAIVDRHFDALFGIHRGPARSAGWGSIDSAPDDGTPRLATAGYASPGVDRRARPAADRRPCLQLPVVSRRRFDALVRFYAQRPRPPSRNGIQPPACTARDDQRARVGIWRCWSASTTLLRLAQLMGASAWAADYLTQHPILLDELLDSRALFAEPDWDAWRRELTAALAVHAGDVERQMDALRHFQHANTFRLLAQV
jgi:glutamate-ammonia-ligase adenylyltransferase